MDDKWFSPAVTVGTQKPGLARSVNHAQGAMEQLQEWGPTGPKWRKAVDVCSKCLIDAATPDDCRKAFEAAAKEGGKLRDR